VVDVPGWYRFRTVEFAYEAAQVDKDIPANLRMAEPFSKSNENCKELRILPNK
jgi:hypothetical protein